MNMKGQGALEYLLLIGGALIVVAVVLTVLPNLASSGKGAVTDAGNQAIGSIVGIVKCSDNTTEEICSAKAHCVWDAVTLCDADCAVITQKSICDSEKCTWDAATATCS
ncbi:MAG: class III signal peptide-containing protein [archaeon]